MLWVWCYLSKSSVLVRKYRSSKDNRKDRIEPRLARGEYIAKVVSFVCYIQTFCKFRKWLSLRRSSNLLNSSELLRGCLYGRRDGMFAGTGRFSSRVYMRMFLPGTISPRTICKVSIISSRQSETECLYDKKCSSLAGILVERTRIPLRRNGTKNAPAKFFPYKRNGTKRDIYMHGEILFNVQSRLPYKQPLRTQSQIRATMRHTYWNRFSATLISLGELWLCRRQSRKSSCVRRLE